MVTLKEIESISDFDKKFETLVRSVGGIMEDFTVEELKDYVDLDNNPLNYLIDVSKLREMIGLEKYNKISYHGNVNNDKIIVTFTIPCFNLDLNILIYTTDGNYGLSLIKIFDEVRKEEFYFNVTNIDFKESLKYIFTVVVLSNLYCKENVSEFVRNIVRYISYKHNNHYLVNSIKHN